MHSSFYNDLYFLSNMYPCRIVYMGLDFCCSESAYQASKCTSIKDMKFFCQLDGYAAKKHGKKIDRRNDFEECKLKIMFEILSVKFILNPELKEKLLKVPDNKFVENNTWHDTYWGVCD